MSTFAGRSGHDRVTVAQFVRHHYWPTVEPALARSGVGRERAILDNLMDTYGSRPVQSVRVEDMDAWWARRRAVTAPATCNRHLVRVKLLFDSAVRWGYLERSPVAHLRKLRPPKGRVRYLTDDQRARLIEAAPDAIRPYILAARYTAGRRGNLWELRRRDLDLEGGILRFPKTKNGDSHEIPVTAGLLRAFGTLPDDPEAFLLPRMAPESISRAFRKLTRRVGLTDFRFHDLRHDVASSLAMAGRPQKAIMDILGHRDPRMSVRYTHLSTDALRGMIEGL